MGWGPKVEVIVAPCLITTPDNYITILDSHTVCAMRTNSSVSVLQICMQAGLPRHQLSSSIACLCWDGQVPGRPPTMRDEHTCLAWCHHGNFSGAQAYPRVRKHTRGCTSIPKGAQTYPRVRKHTRGRASIPKGAQAYPRVHKHTQGCTGIPKGAQASAVPLQQRRTCASSRNAVRVCTILWLFNSCRSPGSWGHSRQENTAHHGCSQERMAHHGWCAAKVRVRQTQLLGCSRHPSS